MSRGGEADEHGGDLPEPPWEDEEYSKRVRERFEAASQHEGFVALATSLRGGYTGDVFGTRGDSSDALRYLSRLGAAPPQVQRAMRFAGFTVARGEEDVGELQRAVRGAVRRGLEEERAQTARSASRRSPDEAEFLSLRKHRPASRPIPATIAAARALRQRTRGRRGKKRAGSAKGARGVQGLSLRTVGKRQVRPPTSPLPIRASPRVGRPLRRGTRVQTASGGTRGRGMVGSGGDGVSSLQQQGKSDELWERGGAGDGDEQKEGWEEGIDGAEMAFEAAAAGASGTAVARVKRASLMHSLVRRMSVDLVGGDGHGGSHKGAIGGGGQVGAGDAEDAAFLLSLPDMIDDSKAAMNAKRRSRRASAIEVLPKREGEEEGSGVDVDARVLKGKKKKKKDVRKRRASAPAITGFGERDSEQKSKLWESLHLSAAQGRWKKRRASGGSVEGGDPFPFEEVSSEEEEGEGGDDGDGGGGDSESDDDDLDGVGRPGSGRSRMSDLLVGDDDSVTSSEDEDEIEAARLAKLAQMQTTPATPEQLIADIVGHRSGAVAAARKAQGVEGGLVDEVDAAVAMGRDDDELAAVAAAASKRKVHRRSVADVVAKSSLLGAIRRMEAQAAAEAGKAGGPGAPHSPVLGLSAVGRRTKRTVPNSPLRPKDPLHGGESQDSMGGGLSFSKLVGEYADAFSATKTTSGSKEGSGVLESDGDEEGETGDGMGVGERRKRRKMTTRLGKALAGSSGVVDSSAPPTPSSSSSPPSPGSLSSRRGKRLPFAFTATTTAAPSLAPEERQRSLRQQAARAVRRLAETESNRPRILGEGALGAIRDIFRDTRSPITEGDALQAAAMLTSIHHPLPTQSLAIISAYHLWQSAIPTNTSSSTTSSFSSSTPSSSSPHPHRPSSPSAPNSTHQSVASWIQATAAEGEIDLALERATHLPSGFVKAVAGVAEFGRVTGVLEASSLAHSAPIPHPQVSHDIWGAFGLRMKRGGDTNGVEERLGGGEGAAPFPKDLAGPAATRWGLCLGATSARRAAMSILWCNIARDIRARSMILKEGGSNAISQLLLPRGAALLASMVELAAASVARGEVPALYDKMMNSSSMRGRTRRASSTEMRTTAISTVARPLGLEVVRGGGGVNISRAAKDAIEWLVTASTSSESHPLPGALMLARASAIDALAAMNAVSAFASLCVGPATAEDAAGEAARSGRRRASVVADQSTELPRHHPLSPTAREVRRAPSNAGAFFRALASGAAANAKGMPGSLPRILLGPSIPTPILPTTSTIYAIRNAWVRLSPFARVELSARISTALFPPLGSTAVASQAIADGAVPLLVDAARESFRGLIQALRWLRVLRTVINQRRLHRNKFEKGSKEHGAAQDSVKRAKKNVQAASHRVCYLLWANRRIVSSILQAMSHRHGITTGLSVWGTRVLTESVAAAILVGELEEEEEMLARTRRKQRAKKRRRAGKGGIGGGLGQGAEDDEEESSSDEESRERESSRFCREGEKEREEEGEGEEEEEGDDASSFGAASVEEFGPLSLSSTILGLGHTPHVENSTLLSKPNFDSSKPPWLEETEGSDDASRASIAVGLMGARHELATWLAPFPMIRRVACAIARAASHPEGAAVVWRHGGGACVGMCIEYARHDRRTLSAALSAAVLAGCDPVYARAAVRDGLLAALVRFCLDAPADMDEAEMIGSNGHRVAEGTSGGAAIRSPTSLRPPDGDRLYLLASQAIYNLTCHTNLRSVLFQGCPDVVVPEPRQSSGGDRPWASVHEAASSNVAEGVLDACTAEHARRLLLLGGPALAPSGPVVVVDVLKKQEESDVKSEKGGEGEEEDDDTIESIHGVPVEPALTDDAPEDSKETRSKSEKVRDDDDDGDDDDHMRIGRIWPLQRRGTGRGDVVRGILALIDYAYIFLGDSEGRRKQTEAFAKAVKRAGVDGIAGKTPAPLPGGAAALKSLTRLRRPVGTLCDGSSAPQLHGRSVRILSYCLGALRLMVSGTTEKSADALSRGLLPLHVHPAVAKKRVEVELDSCHWRVRLIDRPPATESPPLFPGGSVISLQATPAAWVSDPLEFEDEQSAAAAAEAMASGHAHGTVAEAASMAFDDEDTGSVKRLGPSVERILVSAGVVDGLLTVLAPRRNDPFGVVSGLVGATGFALKLVPLVRAWRERRAKREQTIGATGRRRSAAVRKRSAAFRGGAPSTSIGPSLVGTSSAPLPLPCVVDAVTVVTALARDPRVRADVVRAGALPLLVPIAVNAPVSTLALSRAYSLRNLRQIHEDTLAAAAVQARLSNSRAHAVVGGRVIDPNAAASSGDGTEDDERDVKAAVFLGKGKTPSGSDLKAKKGSGRAGGGGRGGGEGGSGVKSFGSGSSGGKRGERTVRARRTVRAANILVALRAANPALKARLTHLESHSNLSSPLPARKSLTERRESAALSPAARAAAMRKEKEMAEPSIAPRKAKGPRPEKGVEGLGASVDPSLIREQSRLERLATLTRQQCALGLCFLATGISSTSLHQVDGVIRALKALAAFGRDGDAVRMRVAIALHALSRARAVARAMAREGIVPVLVRFSASKSDLVRREAVAALRRVSQYRGNAVALFEADATRALQALATIRSHDPDVRSAAVETLHNILAEPRARHLVLRSDSGVLFLLQRLCLAPAKSVRRAAALTLARLASDPEAQRLLLNRSGLRGVVRVLRFAMLRGGATGASGSDPEAQPPKEPSTSEMDPVELALDPSSEVSDFRHHGSTDDDEPPRGMSASALRRSAEQAERRSAPPPDPTVSALLAAALAAIASRGGHETVLVAAGAVEVLVALTGVSTTLPPSRPSSTGRPVSTPIEREKGFAGDGVEGDEEGDFEAVDELIGEGEGEGEGEGDGSIGMIDMQASVEDQTMSSLEAIATDTTAPTSATTTPAPLRDGPLPAAIKQWGGDKQDVSRLGFPLWTEKGHPVDPIHDEETARGSEYRNDWEDPFSPVPIHANAALAALGAIPASDSSSSSPSSPPSGAKSSKASLQQTHPLRSSCTRGLFHLACSKDHRVRNSVTRGGAMFVFVRLGTDGTPSAVNATGGGVSKQAPTPIASPPSARGIARKHSSFRMKAKVPSSSLITSSPQVSAAIRRAQCLVGAIHLLWGASLEKQRTMAKLGVVRLFVEAASDPDLRARYAGAVGLHYSSTRPSMVRAMIADGAIEAITMLLGRFFDSYAEHPEQTVAGFSMDHDVDDIVEEDDSEDDEGEESAENEEGSALRSSDSMSWKRLWTRAMVRESAALGMAALANLAGSRRGLRALKQPLLVDPLATPSGVSRIAVSEGDAARAHVDLDAALMLGGTGSDVAASDLSDMGSPYSSPRIGRATSAPMGGGLSPSHGSSMLRIGTAVARLASLRSFRADTHAPPPSSSPRSLPPRSPHSKTPRGPPKIDRSSSRQLRKSTLTGISLCTRCCAAACLVLAAEGDESLGACTSPLERWSLHMLVSEATTVLSRASLRQECAQALVVGGALDALGHVLAAADADQTTHRRAAQALRCITSFPSASRHAARKARLPLLARLAVVTAHEDAAAAPLDAPLPKPPTQTHNISTLTPPPSSSDRRHVPPSPTTVQSPKKSFPSSTAISSSSSSSSSAASTSIIPTLPPPARRITTARPKQPTPKARGKRRLSLLVYETPRKIESQRQSSRSEAGNIGESIGGHSGAAASPSSSSHSVGSEEVEGEEKGGGEVEIRDTVVQPEGSIVDGEGASSIGDGGGDDEGDSDDGDEAGVGIEDSVTSSTVTASSSVALAALEAYSIRADVARAMCNIAREPKARRGLASVGASAAFIAVAEDPRCSASLRKGCMRALCEVAIEGSEIDIDTLESTEEMKKEVTEQVGSGSLGGNSAVPALLAVMRDHRETADEVPAQLSSASIPGYGPEPGDAMLCDPSRRIAAAGDPRLYRAGALLAAHGDPEVAENFLTMVPSRPPSMLAHLLSIHEDIIVPEALSDTKDEEGLASASKVSLSMLGTSSKGQEDGDAKLLESAAATVGAGPWPKLFREEPDVLANKSGMMLLPPGDEHSESGASSKRPTSAGRRHALHSKSSPTPSSASSTTTSTIAPSRPPGRIGRVGQAGVPPPALQRTWSLGRHGGRDAKRLIGLGKSGRALDPSGMALTPVMENPKVDKRTLSRERRRLRKRAKTQKKEARAKMLDAMARGDKVAARRFRRWSALPDADEVAATSLLDPTMHAVVDDKEGVEKKDGGLRLSAQPMKPENFSGYRKRVLVPLVSAADAERHAKGRSSSKSTGYRGGRASVMSSVLSRAPGMASPQSMRRTRLESDKDEDRGDLKEDGEDRLTALPSSSTSTMRATPSLLDVARRVDGAGSVVSGTDEEDPEDAMAREVGYHVFVPGAEGAWTTGWSGGWDDNESFDGDGDEDDSELPSNMIAYRPHSRLPVAGMSKVWQERVPPPVWPSAMALLLRLETLTKSIDEHRRGRRQRWDASVDAGELTWIADLCMATGVPLSSIHGSNGLAALGEKDEAIELAVVAEADFEDESPLGLIPVHPLVDDSSKKSRKKTGAAMMQPSSRLPNVTPGTEVIGPRNAPPGNRIGEAHACGVPQCALDGYLDAVDSPSLTHNRSWQSKSLLFLTGAGGWVPKELRTSNGSPRFGGPLDADVCPRPLPQNVQTWWSQICAILPTDRVQVPRGMRPSIRSQLRSRTRTRTRTSSRDADSLMHQRARRALRAAMNDPLLCGVPFGTGTDPGALSSQMLTSLIATARAPRENDARITSIAGVPLSVLAGSSVADVTQGSSIDPVALVDTWLPPLGITPRSVTLSTSPPPPPPPRAPPRAPPRGKFSSPPPAAPPSPSRRSEDESRGDEAAAELEELLGEGEDASGGHILSTPSREDGNGDVSIPTRVPFSPLRTPNVETATPRTIPVASSDVDVDTDTHHDDERVTTAPTTTRRSQPPRLRPGQRGYAEQARRRFLVAAGLVDPDATLDSIPPIPTTSTLTATGTMPPAARSDEKQKYDMQLRPPTSIPHRPPQPQPPTSRARLDVIGTVAAMGSGFVDFLREKGVWRDKDMRTHSREEEEDDEILQGPTPPPPPGLPEAPQM